MKLILPGSTIGIVGGGQLGKMMTLAAKAMGYTVIILDEHKTGPAIEVADDHVVASFKDTDGFKALAGSVDVLTYEFENIESASILEAMKDIYIPQGDQPLKITQDRLREKKAIEAAGGKVAPYRAVEGEAELKTAISTIGYPCVLKTRRDGYDGKGQVVLKGARDLKKCDAILNVPCILEAFVPFDFEASVIGVRSTSGEIKLFPAGYNIHENNILYETQVPGPIDEKQKIALNKMALQLMEALGFYGTLAIEFFVKGETIYINEMAPRPHNSGHYTIEGCLTSQFEQHIRAICGLPLGSTDLVGETHMYNLLGQHMAACFKWLPEMSQACHLHLYGKKEATVNRKMGHVTFVNSSSEDRSLFINKVLKGS